VLLSCQAKYEAESKRALSQVASELNREKERGREAERDRERERDSERESERERESEWERERKALIELRDELSHELSRAGQEVEKERRRREEGEEEAVRKHRIHTLQVHVSNTLATH